MHCACEERGCMPSVTSALASERDALSVFMLAHELSRAFRELIEQAIVTTALELSISLR